MSPWLGKDNKVQRFYRPHKKVISRRHAPKGFAWEEDLYRIQTPNAKNPVEVEERLARIEDAALPVRDKILASGVASLSYLERAKFSLFLATLLVRRPDMVTPKIAPAQEDIENRFLDALKSPIKDGKIDQSKVIEISAGLGSALVLQAMLDTAKRWTVDLFALEWRDFDLRAGGLPIVLADNPFKMWGSEEKRLAKFTIPLAPYHVLVGGKAQSWTEIRYQEEFRQVLAIDFIGDQFRAAQHFAVGVDSEKNDAYLEIANKNWGKDAERRRSS